MEITLSNGIIVNVLLIDIAGNYIDFEIVGTPGHMRSDVELTDYASALDEMTAALERDLATEEIV